MIQMCYFPKIVALLCGISVLILITASLGSSAWLVSDGFHQGIWYHCVFPEHEKPLPPGINDNIGCFDKPFKLYIFITGVLLTVAVFFDFIASCLLAVTLHTCAGNLGRKTTVFRVARGFFIFSFICCLSALTLFSVMFALEYRQWGRRNFEFGWAFGLGWGSVIFLLGAVLLLICDPGTDTVYYAAKTMDFP